MGSGSITDLLLFLLDRAFYDDQVLKSTSPPNCFISGGQPRDWNVLKSKRLVICGKMIFKTRHAENQ